MRVTIFEDAGREQLTASLGNQHRRPFRLITVKGELVSSGKDLDRVSALLSADDEERYAKRGSVVDL